MRFAACGALRNVLRTCPDESQAPRLPRSNVFPRLQRWGEQTPYPQPGYNFEQRLTVLIIESKGCYVNRFLWVSVLGSTLVLFDKF
jgi:hypothetical protein